MKFGTQMLWRERKNHNDDCFFCLVNIKGIIGGNQSKWTYPDIDSAKRLVANSDEIPAPTFTHLVELSQEDESSTTAVNSTRE